jgi:virulence factor Mce-like protein
MRLDGWHVDIDVSLKPDVVVPANAVATVGQTSLLGSMHVALDPPPGQAPTGRLEPGATIGLNDSSSYPSTERTLASLAAVVNGGGLGQIGDIIHNFNTALTGRQDSVRDLITRLDTFVGTLYQQRDNIVSTIDELNRFSSTLGGQQQVLTRALNKIPPALDVLIKERPQLTAALEQLGTFSQTVSGLVNDTQADLVKNLQNLQPTLQALADVGPEIDTALAYIPTFPLTQNLIDRGVRGDYVNLWVTVDLTNARIKRGLLLGTRLGQDRASLIPAPGDAGYDAYYTKFPLGVGTSPPFGPIPNAAPAPWEPGGGG